MSLNWTGEEVLRALEEKAADGVLDWADAVFAVADPDCPENTGRLRNSGKVSQEGLTAAVSYDTPYAPIVHENPQWHFRNGRHGKWLEIASHQVDGEEIVGKATKW